MCGETANLSLAFGTTAFWWALLIVAALAMGAGVLLARRVCLRSGGTRPRDDDSLEHLRSLRDSGHISKDEFAAIRRKVLDLGAAAREKDISKSSAAGELDDSTTSTPEG